MLIDAFIILIVLYVIIRNWERGLISQALSIAGLIIGLALGRLVETYAVSLVHTPVNRALIVAVCIFGLGVIGLSVGESVGLKLKYRLPIKRFNFIDNTLGSVLTGITVLIVIWFSASVINNLPATKAKSYLQQSRIISAMSRLLPSAPQIVSDLGHIIDPNGFPDVFIGTEPVPNTQVTTPSLGSLINVVNSDRKSVVKIEGDGCGGVVTGSGFVVGENLVATNAHVVAGIAAPIVDDVNGDHRATVVAFDPNLDLAVLRVYGLAGQPLNLDTDTVNQGTAGAVLGYPGGGNFTADPAAVIDQFIASGHNIYGSGVVNRHIYSIDADVIPGNSGGPLINTDGSVIGVVFAQSTTYKDVGYALTMPKVASEIHAASNLTAAVSTRQCAE